MNSRDVSNSWSNWKGVDEGPIKIEQSSSLMNIRLIRDNLTINWIMW
jgi:hypothetical protein